MHRVVLLDHLNAGSAVLGDLVNVRPFHETEAYICVPEAVGCTAVAVAINLQSRLFEHVIEELDVVAWKHKISLFRCVSLFQTIERSNGPGRALAVANTTLAAYFNFRTLSPIGSPSTSSMSRYWSCFTSSGRKPVFAVN